MDQRMTGALHVANFEGLKGIIGHLEEYFSEPRSFVYHKTLDLFEAKKDLTQLDVELKKNAIDGFYYHLFEEKQLAADRKRDCTSFSVCIGHMTGFAGIAVFAERQQSSESYLVAFLWCVGAWAFLKLLFY